MAIKTMSISSGGNDFTPGWRETLIKTAKYGSDEIGGVKRNFLDITFEGLPENMNVRVYAANNKTTKEEFRIANWFRFSNAGIQEVLDNGDGKPVITYDDDSSNLIGMPIGIFLFSEISKKDDREYSRIWRDPAPTEMEAEHQTYTEKEVNFWRKRAESSYNSYREYMNGSSNEENSNTPF